MNEKSNKSIKNEEIRKKQQMKNLTKEYKIITSMYKLENCY